MTIIERINELKQNNDVLVQRKDELVRKENNAFFNAQNKGVFCGKCNNGWKRIKFESGLFNAEKMDGNLKHFFESGYPTHCECMGTFDLLQQIDAIEKKISDSDNGGCEIQRIENSREYIGQRIGHDYKDKSIYINGNAQNVDIVLRWINDGAKTPLAIIGESGTGKTHLLCGIANEITLKKMSYMIVKAERINSMTDKSITPSDEMAERVKMMSTIQVLMIDDIMKAKMTDALYADVWFPIFDARRNNGRATIITLDGAIDDFATQYAQVSSNNRNNISALKNRMLWAVEGETYAKVVFLKSVKK
jgi:DNA replication protein DnaC